MAAVPADPFSSFFGNVGSGLGKGLGDALSGGPDGPSISGAGSFDLRGFMDGSGWTVSTGSSKATGGARTQTGDPWGTPASISQAGLGGSSLGPLGALALAAGAGWVIWKWVL